MDLALILGTGQEINGLLAGAVIEDQQVIGQVGVLPQAAQAGLEHIQGLGVEAAQEGDVVQDGDGDALGLGNFFDELGRVLAFSHRCLSL